MRLAGARIRAVRRARGLTQEELASATGVSRSAVAQWETGRAGCGTGRLRMIASALEVPLRELQTGAPTVLSPTTPIDGRHLSVAEQEIVRLFRDLDGTDQACLLQVARRFAMPVAIDIPSMNNSGAERRVMRSVR